ncbi:MAG: hypothetical protein ACRDE7_10345 [Sphingobacterium sp.]
MKNSKEQLLVNHPKMGLTDSVVGWTALQNFIGRDELDPDRKCPIITP